MSSQSLYVHATTNKAMNDKPKQNNQDIAQLYVDNHSWLYSWLCKKLPCKYQAEDVAQNTFLRLFNFTNLSSINEPRGFLTTTATRLIIDESRRKKVEQRYLETYSYHHGSEEAVALSSEHLTLVSEKLAIIIQMLEHLPEKCQRAFVMSKFDGMRYADIAKELNVSTGMVQQYMTKTMIAYYKVCVEYNDSNNTVNENTEKSAAKSPNTKNSPNT